MMHIFGFTFIINYGCFQKLNLSHRAATLKAVYGEFIVLDQLLGFHFS